MNKENEEFLKRNGINIDELNRTVDAHIYSREEVNPIVAEYNFQKASKKGKVSISKIIGYDADFRNIPSNIFQSMDDYFDVSGDGYHSRSVGMLDYSKENIIEKLSESFKDEPISVIETGEGNYTIFFNGLHRYTLLRILYLSEIAKVQGNNEEIERINRKYNIPVDITEVDLVKTYCKYLLIKSQLYSTTDNDIRDISTHYDERYRQTENVEIKYIDGTKQLVSNEELLQISKQFMREKVDISSFSTRILEDYNQYQSFKNFIDENFSDIFILNENNNTERRTDDDSRDD